MAHTSIRAAVAVGTVWVNLPVLALMFSPLALFVLAMGSEANRKASPAMLVAMLAMFVLGIVLAWVWWSIMVPRWRLWAWSRVDDIASLKIHAVKAGLIWPEGHFFERTELPSKKTQEALRAIESSSQKDA